MTPPVSTTRTKKTRSVAKSGDRAVSRPRLDFVPTLADVAREAGVATSTASAVLGNKDYCAVTPETRERILHACQRLGYKPNPVARAIRNQRSGSIGLILPGLLTNGVLGEQIRSIESCIRAHSLSMMLATHQYQSELETSAIHDQVLRAVDGIVLYPAGEMSDSLRKLIDSRFPLVTIDTTLPVSTWNVEVDRFYGGYLQARHLIERGRRKLLVVRPKRDSRTAVTKQAGRERAMEEAGISMPASHTIFLEAPDGDWAGAARVAVDRVVSEGLKFDAVCTNTDIVALGVISALRSHSVRVPEDVAVIGFDDEPFSRFLTPALTTVRQPRNLGDRVFELLWQQIEAGQEGRRLTPVDARLTPELIVRQST